MCSYFNLPPMATTPQWPVNFVPVGAILERFDCSKKRLQGQGSPTLQAVDFSYTTACRGEVLHPLTPSPPYCLASLTNLTKFFILFNIHSTSFAVEFFGKHYRCTQELNKYFLSNIYSINTFFSQSTWNYLWSSIIASWVENNYHN